MSTIAARYGQEIHLHGRTVTFLEAGAESGGPVVVLLHGLASSSLTWASLLPRLEGRVHVIAPDLLGHGRSAKPRGGDYSLGSHAADLRDLLVALGVDGVTVVGHSFGGGVAMQFAYQFPELTERLVLVASGGLGHEVSFALRAATLPGTATVLKGLAAVTPPWLGRFVRRTARLAPSAPATEIDSFLDALTSFAEAGASGAFARTVGGVLDWSGQRLEGTERLYLLAGMPTLFVGGDRDRVIPVAHTMAAHELVPGSRLEIFDGAGHFPHMEQPRRFAKLLLGFLAETAPARIDRQSLRRHLLEHPSSAAAGG